jgi:hypothetical protein
MVAILEFYESLGRLLVGLRSKTSLGSVYPSAYVALDAARQSTLSCRHLPQYRTPTPTAWRAPSYFATLETAWTSLR